MINNVWKQSVRVKQWLHVFWNNKFSRIVKTNFDQKQQNLPYFCDSDETSRDCVQANDW